VPKRPTKGAVDLGGFLVERLSNGPSQKLRGRPCFGQPAGAVLRMVLGCGDGLAGQMRKRLAGRMGAERFADGLNRRRIPEHREKGF